MVVKFLFPSSLLYDTEYRIVLYYSNIQVGLMMTIFLGFAVAEWPPYFVKGRCPGFYPLRQIPCVRPPIGLFISKETPSAERR